MKVIIAGGRARTEPYSTPKIYGYAPTVVYQELEKAMMECNMWVDTVISGGATGVDRLGELWARNHNKGIRVFPANWNPNGRAGMFDKAAGIKRNTQMGDFADGLVAIWDGKSKGTQHMIHYMRSLGKPVHVRLLGEPK